MRNASNDYKIAMESMMRGRAYISISLGLVNINAQKTAHVESACVDWCRKDAIFTNNKVTKEYATLEENYFKLDGSMHFIADAVQKVSPEAISKNVMEDMVIKFNGTYAIKGLTLEFGSTYPVEFDIEADNFYNTYTNESVEFITSDSIGETSYIKIIPKKMVGGQQRLRLRKATMGIGLSFGNADVQNFSCDDTVSLISEELPSENVTINILDKYNQFNVDDKNSYVQFLETGQEIKILFGATLKDKTIEWIPYTTLYLSDWDSQKGKLRISATDKLSSLNDEYSGSNKIFERTAYDEAISILSDAGLSNDDYILDDYLKEVILNNPMPIAPHRECLQLLANASRCIIRHNNIGQIVVKANFVNSITSDEINVSSNTEASWSNSKNIINGADIVYADMSYNFFRLDGSMCFLPENNEDYLNNGYVSNQMSDANGYFESNPKISIDFPASYSYQSINIEFGGNAPEEIKVYTYIDNDFVQEEYFYNPNGREREIIFSKEFKPFNRIVVEFIQAAPYARVIVNKIGFGDLSDYILKRAFMKSEPHGYVEEKIKTVNVRLFHFELDENGVPYDTKEDIIVKKTINANGKNILLENQLISQYEHAHQIAAWLANYYANNISYDVDYRGEPRIEAGDIIKMENEYLKDLHIAIYGHSLNFNGGISGSISAKRALKAIQTRSD